MKILLIHDFYQNFGGEDSIALREKKLLEEHGEEVHFYTRDNAEIKDYGLREKFLFPLRTVYSSQTVRQLDEVVAAFQPDVAYTHNIFPLVSPAVFHYLYRRGIPCVQNVQDFRWLCPNGLFYIGGEVCERCKRGAFWNAIPRRCFRDSIALSSIYATAIAANRAAGVFRKVAAFACATPYSKGKFLEAGVSPERLFVKPNYVVPDQFEPSFQGGEYAVFLGRLSAEKGLWTMVRAFESCPDIPLRIAGTGPLEELLRDYLAEHKLTHITLEGFVEGQQKADLLQKAAFMVFPSEWYEHFPIVLLEAFAAGLPVVATRLGNMPYIVEDQRCGLLYQPGEAKELAEKVKAMAEDTDGVRRMGQYARSLVDSIYGPEENYRILMDIFESARRRRGQSEEVT